jgi:alkylation response protein AidB-like acyl-CoA dehydrogenase
LIRMDEVKTTIDPDWWQPLGMEATASYRVDFSGVEVGSDDLIGGPGDYYRDPWFGAGAVRFTAVQLGGAEALYDATRRYIAELHRGPDHPPAQWRAAEMAAAVEGGNLWLRGGADMWERPPEESEAIVNYAAMMRLAIETICNRVIAHAETSASARGLMRSYPMGRVIRDLTMYLRQPAADAVISRLGRHVLADSRPAHQQWAGSLPQR